MSKGIIIDFKTNGDERGFLTSIEGEKEIPFKINRVFYMHHVVENRGGHAHIDTDQVVIPISGQFIVSLFDGEYKKEYIMNDCTKGLYIPRLVYTDLYDFSKDAVCLVLANTHYDIGRSLRSLEAYMDYLKVTR